MPKIRTSNRTEPKTPKDASERAVHLTSHLEVWEAMVYRKILVLKVVTKIRREASTGKRKRRADTISNQNLESETASVSDLAFREQANRSEPKTH